MNTWMRVVLCLQAAAAAEPSETLVLTRNGEAACKVVCLSQEEPERLMNMAARAIADTVRDWDGVRLEVVASSAGPPPGEPAIVLTTWEHLRRVRPEAATSDSVVLRTQFLDEHGFICVPIAEGSVTRMWVVGRSVRGVYNGAVYVRDFLIDGGRGDLFLELETVVRTPQMRGRPVYLLTIWGEEDEYTVEDYRTVFESFARDGVSHVYFWLSGHFPSEKFPQTYKLSNGPWDSTTDSAIGTLDDQRRLIREAHELGMGFYIGGALGAWCGTFNLTHRESGTMRTGSVDETGIDVSDWSLCPSSPRARRALVAYYKEMYDALPEADGLFIESADEYGQCRCERCEKPVDALGSKMFGQNQLSLMREMMDTVWKDHPHARLAYTIGYAPHVKAPAYYEVVRQMSADARIEWMETRDSWAFPDARGEPLPAACFSPRVMRWEYSDQRPLEQMVRHTMRAASTGMYGFIMTFSPGFSSGSFYHDRPFPTHLLPYVMTHFVYREATWFPARTVEEMKGRVQRRFFGKEAPETLSDDLWTLREILRESANRKISVENRKALDGIENRIDQARPGASPKTEAGLSLMRRAIEDIRRLCEKEPSGSN